MDTEPILTCLRRGLVDDCLYLTGLPYRTAQTNSNAEEFHKINERGAQKDAKDPSHISDNRHWGEGGEDFQEGLFQLVKDNLHFTNASIPPS